MLVKLGIIGVILVLGGMMFSTEISTLFPNTSASLMDSLKNDMEHLNEKTTGSAGDRLDTSFNNMMENVSDKVYGSITETGDKLVENVNEQISETITETGNNIKNEISESHESSKEIIVDEISDYNPFDFIKTLFGIN